MLVCLIGMGCEETEPEYEEPKHRTAHCFYEGLHFVMRRRVHSALTIGDSQSTGYARSHFNYNPIPYLFTSRDGRNHGTILSTLQIFRKHCSYSCSIFRNSTVFLSLLVRPAWPKNMVFLLPRSLVAVIVRCSSSHFGSVSACSLYSLVNLRKPDDVWSLAWVIY